ncbi:pectinesterase inhibitor 9-like [Dioscorea cayenensis subsp. rotundata]|uniref:Pectinesterase inhibitor 9-like n=1 Tax=Dioscorea cayennensis subsp. rotundata TaxID=55577 RepID=A0AB40CZZ4_DIOCR|nr:pectinesterase inhibitor 9-like [Dioscorea cayenensis subsp. rotundata]
MASSKLFLLLAISTITVTSSPTQSAKKPSTSAANFILKSCNATGYPNLCVSSLSPSAAAINSNPFLLSGSAASIALSRLRATRSRISALANTTSTGRESAALRDCADTLGDAVDQTSKSAKYLGKMAAGKGAGSGSIAWRVSGVQTWMSAALTNEGTCGDGFDGVPMDSVVKKVVAMVAVVKMYSSNALALVNILVS